MQRMIMIPEERYDRMVESYDTAVRELLAIRDQIHEEGAGIRQQLNHMLDQMSEMQLKKTLFLAEGILGGAR